MNNNPDDRLAEKLFCHLMYIKNRKEAGLSAYELTVEVPTEEYIRIAEGFIELQKQKAQSND